MLSPFFPISAAAVHGNFRRLTRCLLYSWAECGVPGLEVFPNILSSCFVDRGFLCPILMTDSIVSLRKRRRHRVKEHSQSLSPIDRTANCFGMSAIDRVPHAHRCPSTQTLMPLCLPAIVAMCSGVLQRKVLSRLASAALLLLAL